MEFKMEDFIVLVVGLAIYGIIYVWCKRDQVIRHDYKHAHCALERSVQSAEDTLRYDPDGTKRRAEMKDDLEKGLAATARLQADFAATKRSKDEFDEIAWPVMNQRSAYWLCYSHLRDRFYQVRMAVLRLERALETVEKYPYKNVGALYGEGLVRDARMVLTRLKNVAQEDEEFLRGYTGRELEIPESDFWEAFRRSATRYENHRMLSQMRNAHSRAWYTSRSTPWRSSSISPLLIMPRCG